MEWLSLDFDESPALPDIPAPKPPDAVQSSSTRVTHDSKGGGEAVIFKIPQGAERIPGVADTGTIQVPCIEVPVVVSFRASTTPAFPPRASPLRRRRIAGFKTSRCSMPRQVLLTSPARKGKSWTARWSSNPGAAKLDFTRRTITYDTVKGDMSKPWTAWGT